MSTSRTKKSFVVLLAALITFLSESSAVPVGDTGYLQLSFWQQMSFGGAALSSYSTNTFDAILPTCSAELTSACIELVEVEEAGNWVALESSEVSANDAYCVSCNGYTQKTWKGDLEENLPPGAIASRWSNSKYSLIADVSLGGIYSGTFNTYGAKYSVGLLSYRLNPEIGKSLPNTPIRIIVNNRKGLKVFNQFLNGRLLGGEMAYLGNGRIQITGSPVQVSTARTIRWTLPNIPSDVRDFIDSIHYFPDSSTWGEQTAAIAYSIADSPEVFSKFEKYLDPTQTQDALSWFAETGTAVGFGDNPCSNSVVPPGISTSNANIFTSGVPKWNPTDSSFDFYMASPHLDSKGNPTVGNLDLSIEESYAKCLWGVTEVPSEAAISVVYADGNAQVGTVILGVRDHYINFHVNGFHFSAPQVKIKLKLAKPSPTPTPTATSMPTAIPTPPTPTPTLTASPISVKNSKLTTILCIKGKSLKKLTVKNPKCPVWFKLRK